MLSNKQRATDCGIRIFNKEEFNGLHSTILKTSDDTT